MEVCGQASSGREAIEAIASLAPDLAVLDLALEDMDGMDLLREVHTRHERTLVLVLSRHEEALFAERALRAGARGYVMKHEGLLTVLKALRQVLAGDVFLSDQMRSKVLRNLVGGKRRGENSPPSSLSDRELQVFTMIGQGLGPTAIAQRLHLSVKTIDAHRARIKVKLGLGSAEELRQSAIAWLRDHDVSA